jgi:hypothetical protein
MGEEKTPFSIRLESTIYEKLASYAKKEKRSEANLGEVLMVWAFEQLERVGNSLRLLELNVSIESQPKNVADARDDVIQTSGPAPIPEIIVKPEIAHGHDRVRENAKKALSLARETRAHVPAGTKARKTGSSAEEVTIGNFPAEDSGGTSD